MIQLIYPIEEYAPMLPRKQARDSRATTGETPVTEYLPVIEQTGVVTGMASREYCHSGSKLLHPVVHLHIMDREGRIYLQKRSKDKKIQPGKWDTAVGGHISYGESVIEALYRESEEELGLTQYNPTHILSYIYESEIEKEYISVFAAIGSSFVLKPDKNEIDEGRFWSPAEIESKIGQDVLTPNFESEYLEIRDKLISLL